MRVGFNARLLAEPSLRGWNRYTVNLMAGLMEAGVQLFLYSDAPIHDVHLRRLRSGRYSLRVAPPMTYLKWEQWWLPQACAVDGVDVFHATFHFGLPWRSPAPAVLTLHDAIDAAPGAAHRWQPGCWRPAALRSALSSWIARRRAVHIITVSNYSKRDLINRFGIHPEKITVIFNAADPGFEEPVTSGQKQETLRRYRVRRPYFYYLGGWEARKNIPFLLRAFATAQAPGAELVLAGGKESEIAMLRRMAEAMGIAERVRLLGRIEDKHAAALYADALCFVYPSEYEGFGLQLCEAMVTGCPVLAARRTSLPEILGDGGETFELGDPRELATLLGRVAGDEGYRAELVVRAKRRAAHFSWRRTVMETLDIYAKVTGLDTRRFSFGWRHGEAT